MNYEEIDRNDRISIACTFYGLYMIGLATTEIEKIDENCAMDNFGVPYYKHQLTDGHKQYLENPSEYWTKKAGYRV